MNPVTPPSSWKGHYRTRPSRRRTKVVMAFARFLDGRTGSNLLKYGLHRRNGRPGLIFSFSFELRIIHKQQHFADGDENTLALYTTVSCWHNFSSPNSKYLEHM